MLLKLENLVFITPNDGVTMEQIWQEAEKEGLRLLTEAELGQLLWMESPVSVEHPLNMVFRDGEWVWEGEQETQTDDSL